MKRIFKLGWVGAVLLGQSVSGFCAEDWKGTPDDSDFSIGALGGMGIIGGDVAFTVLGTISRKIVQKGFVPDINDSVSIEAVAGPVFYAGTTVAYGIHLRWDFTKDPNWTLYALGGFGGNVLTQFAATQVQFFPRFGVGAFWRANPHFLVRAEISHESITAGINVPF